MDRKTWVAVSLSVLGLVLWYWYFVVKAPPPPPPAQTAAATPTPQATATPEVAATPVPTPVPVPTMAAREETLASGEGRDKAEFVFNNDAGGIESAILLMHMGENQQAVHLNGDVKDPIGALSTEPGTVMGGFEMSADEAAGIVTFTKKDADGLVIEKKFKVPGSDVKASPYSVDLEVTFRNPTDAAVSRPGYFLSTGSAAPIHESDQSRYTQFQWQHGGKVARVDTNWFNASSIPLIGIQLRPARSVYLESESNVQWASVASQYFCTIVSSVESQGSSVWATRFDVPTKDGGRTVHGLRGALGLPGFTIDAGGSLSQKFEIYAGPKEFERLRSLGQGEQAVLNFGWFGFVSKFLLWAMNKLHDVLGNFAAAIIVLTLLIKSALWPIQNKATNSMRRMSALSPKMTELREKYKDDPTKMNEELMKLYRDYGINPFSGCLPMFIQIPIFFGFYTMLGSAIELRNSSFFWIHDLSQPDTVAHLLGFPINILPLVMAGTMLWQMAITPKSGDPSQQRILMFMPIIFVVIAYNYAAALSLYWTTQNLFSIVQLYLTRNKPLPTLEKVKVAAKRNAEPATKRKGRKS